MAGAGAAAGSMAGGSAGAGGTGDSGGGLATGDEQRAAINRKIDESLLVFDRRIQGEQDALNKERDAATAAGGEAGSGGASGAQGDSTAAGGGAAAGGAAGVGRNGASSGGSVGSGAGGINNGPSHVPADVGNGSDDDIVARQLREAAMKERDPQLQEKLWQEYRDYKKGT